MSPPFRLLAPKPRAIQRDAFELSLADGRVIEVQRVRDPRARRIRLSVDDRGARLTLPARASAAAAERFAIEHRDWIAAQLARHVPADLPSLRPFESTTLPLRDADVPLRWQPGRLCRLEFVPPDDDVGDARHDGRVDVDVGAPTASPTRDGSARATAAPACAPLVFTLPPRAGAAAIARALRDFYEAQARADIGRWLPRYLDGLRVDGRPRAPRRFRLRPMRSQWGSLAPDGTVALDLALVLARPSAFEYVLVHELCHLLHHDHSPSFWAQVEARCPAWRAERDYFRTEGTRLKAGLRALLEPPPPRD
ncbi:hypothetical protein N799_11910 [Lysobacter arseniciresistens ZS79]|uniref:YgjP-like metallopeptidase domain-containing protein n=1 Tax=Lysobacter arseniciresistens ZS79 TaxID=913325 RepID=A0A0A0EQR9_9GAMM|nr:SprT family zinc-dependent metalloprotease [Lysobacter arseniciresistens]KGM53301.1 hypothetical protein N799_11910 [Lysobacter arseniciresistens ZS79]